MSSEKIISSDLIPPSLWKNNELHLPQQLVDCYKTSLINHGLYEEVKLGGREKSSHGGATKAQTLTHFKSMFIGSSGRTEISLISPCVELSQVSNALLSSFSEGNVCLLDIPAGTGAGGLALLATIAHLRDAGLIPTLPLTVKVVAGDYQQDALYIYQSQLVKLESALVDVGIKASFSGQLWDATRADSTADLIRVIDKSADEYIILISNFSGALIKDSLLEDFEPSLMAILGWLSKEKVTLIWLEPAEFGAGKKLATKIVDFIKRYIPWVTKTTPDEYISYTYEMKNPITNESFRSGVQLQQFDRG